MNKHLSNKFENKKIILINIITLIPLLIYGIYKNIFVVYKRGLLNNSDLLTNISIIIITITLPIIIDMLYSIVKKEKLITYLSNSYSLFYSIIFFLLMPPQLNVLKYIVGLLLVQILSKINIKYKANLLAILKIFTILLMLKNYNYLNIYESSKNIYYNLFDSFFGRNIGSYGATNILLIVLSYSILCLTTHYKKEIPIIGVTTFTITGIIYYLIIHSSGFNIVSDLINTNFIFCIVYVAPISFYSPFTKEARVIYALLLGVSSFILIKYISIYEGAIISIAIISLLNNLIDTLVLKIKR